MNCYITAITNWGESRGTQYTSIWGIKTNLLPRMQNFSWKILLQTQSKCIVMDDLRNRKSSFFFPRLYEIRKKHPTIITSTTIFIRARWTQKPNYYVIVLNNWKNKIPWDWNSLWKLKIKLITNWAQAFKTLRCHANLKSTRLYR